MPATKKSADIVFLFYNTLKAINTIPRITSTTPAARFNVSGFALFAKRAAILAQIKVNSTHSARQVRSGMPPIAKCDTAPVNAVNAMINTLVPTAVFNS